MHQALVNRVRTAEIIRQTFSLSWFLPIETSYPKPLMLECFSIVQDDRQFSAYLLRCLYIRPVALIFLPCIMYSDFCGSQRFVEPYSTGHAADICSLQEKKFCMAHLQHKSMRNHLIIVERFHKDSLRTPLQSCDSTSV